MKRHVYKFETYELLGTFDTLEEAYQFQDTQPIATCFITYGDFTNIHKENIQKFETNVKEGKVNGI